MSHTLEDLNKLTKAKLCKLAKTHSVNSFDKKADKEEMIKVLLEHFKPRSRSRSPAKKCKDGEELTKKGNCAKKCKDGQVRNDATGRCRSRSKSPSKAASVEEEPKKKVSKKPSRVKPSPKADQQDLSEEHLKSLGITELKKIAKERGITSLHKYTSKNKQELIDKMKVDEPLRQPSPKQSPKQSPPKPSPPVSPKKCNPQRNEFCDDDEYCETPANICVKNKGDFEELTVNGKKIIGSKESIAALKKHLHPPSPPRPQPPVTDLFKKVDDDEKPIITRIRPEVQGDDLSRVQPMKDEKVKREKPIAKKSDLESMLKNLDVDVKNDLTKLNDLQKVLLTCLFGK